MARKKKTETEVKETKPKKKKLYGVGDIIELEHDHHCMAMDFPAGTKVLITGESEKGFNINNDPEHPEDGFEMIECGLEL